MAGVGSGIWDDLEIEEVEAGEDRVGFLPRWYTAEASSRTETSQDPDTKAPANNAGPPAVDAGLGDRSPRTD